MKEKIRSKQFTILNLRLLKQTDSNAFKTIRSNQVMKKLYSNKLVIFSLVLPGLLLFFFAILAPTCLSVYYGFTDYSGMGSMNFIGMENYKNLMTDKAFWMSLRNSLLLAIGFICIQHPLALITAAVLDKLSGKAEGFFRCVYFIPNVISVAVIAYLWKFIYNPNFGLLNNIIKAFGGKGNINWLSQQNAIWSVLVVLNTIFADREDKPVKAKRRRAA